MRFFFEISWLWKALGIFAATVAVCELLFLLTCKIKKVKPNKNAIFLIACLSFILSAAIVFYLAKTPVPL